MTVRGGASAAGDRGRPGLRPAATVVILRDSPRGLEVLLTERPKHLRFMGGAVVFPGGALAPDDLDASWAKASRRSPSDAANSLGDHSGRSALGLYVCALREAFEEVGFVVGDGPLDGLRRSDAGNARYFLDRCLELGVVLGTDLLVPAGRWVTPEPSPVRFDAHFFVTRAPSKWEPSPDPGEVAAVRWSTPSAALAELAAGRSIMAPPTIEMLQRLDGAAHTSEALSMMTDTRWQDGSNVLAVRLSPRVSVVLAPNPGLLTGPGTNTYVVGTKRTAIIDPAVGDDFFIDALAEPAGPDVSCILVTHRHPDHVGGVEAAAARWNVPVRAFGDRHAGGVEVVPLAEGESFDLEDVRLETVLAPGHSSDHVCFFDREGGALFAGDNVLGEGTAVIAPPDGDMGDYLETLERLRALRPRRIYPGHFRPLDDGVAVLDGYLRHRAARRDAILEALTELGPASVEELVERVYTDVAPNLHPVAALQVQAMLELLQRQGLADETRTTDQRNRWIRRSSD